MNPKDLIYFLQLMSGLVPSQSAYTGADDPARGYVNGANPNSAWTGPGDSSPNAVYPRSAFTGPDDPARGYINGANPNSAFTGPGDPARNYINGAPPGLTPVQGVENPGNLQTQALASAGLAAVLGGTETGPNSPVNGVNMPQNVAPRPTTQLPVQTPNVPTAISGTETPAIYNAPQEVGGILGALADPTVQRALMTLGAGIGGPGSLGESIAGAGTQFLDQRQSAELTARVLGGEDLGTVLGDSRMAGVPQEAVDRAIAGQAQQRQLAQGDRQLDQGDTRLDQGQQQIDLEAIANEAQINAAERGLDLRELEIDLVNRYRNAGLEQQAAELQARLDIAQMQDATTRRGQDLSYKASMANIKSADGGVGAGEEQPDRLSASEFGVIEDLLVQEFSGSLKPGVFRTMRDIQTGRVDPIQFYNALPDEDKEAYNRRMVELENQVRGGANYTSGIERNQLRDAVLQAAQGRAEGEVFTVMGRVFKIEGGKVNEQL